MNDFGKNAACVHEEEEREEKAVGFVTELAWCAEYQERFKCDL